MKTLKEMMEACPKVSDKVCEYFKKQMEASLVDAPPEAKEAFASFVIDADMVNNLVGKQPRILFDFFDDNGYYVSVHFHDGGWWCNIPNVLKVFRKCNTRKEAEVVGIDAAFENLEIALNNVGVSESNTSGGDAI